MIRHLKYFGQYAGKHIPAILLAVLLLGGDVCVTTVLPWYMSEIVDLGVLRGDMETIRQISVRMVVLALFGSVIAFLFSLITSVLSQRISNAMRKDLFRKVLSLSYGQTDAMNPGKLLTRIMSDTQIVTQFGAAVLQMLLKPAALCILGFAMTMIISGRFAPVFAIGIPLQIVLLIIFMKRLTPLFTRIQLKIEKVNSRIQETLSNLRLIKAYVHQDYENRKFQQENRELLDLNLNIQFTLAIMNPLIMLIINLVLIGIIAVGSGLVRSGEAEVGRVIAAIMYIQQIMMSLMMIGQIYQVAAKAAVSCQRMEEIQRMEPSLDPGREPLTEPVRQMEVREVSFRYPDAPPDSPPVLDHVSLRIPAGSFTAIVGPTGSGKSTLAALLARLTEASRGEVLVNGRNILDWTGDSLRGHIVIDLQKSAMCSGTIADNIRYGLNSASPEEVRAAAEIAQADAFISAFPEGYDTEVAQQGASLSGGQQQCIAIARALLRKPDVLILDDSTSSMDLMTESRFRARLRKAFPEMTLVVIAQRMATVTGADRIYVLEEGHIAAEGTHAELMRQSPLYREMVMAQSAGEEALS